MSKYFTQFFKSLAITGILMLSASQSFADEIQSHSTVRATAKAFLLSQTNSNLGKGMEIEITTSRLDPRLKLRQCQLPLESFLPPGAGLSGNTTVGIRCGDHKPWSLYVSAKITKYADVYVSTRYLPRGTRLKKSDITLKRNNISNTSIGYITNINHIVGKILRRPLPHNKIVPPNALDAPMLVKRGQKVTIIAQNTGIQVHMKGKALKNGSEGDLIRVQNLSSKRIIEGRVMSAGVVGVNL